MYMRALDGLEGALFGYGSNQIIKECSFAAWNAIRINRYKKDYVSWRFATGEEGHLKCERSCRDTYNTDRERQEKAWKKCIADHDLGPIPRGRALSFEELSANFSL